MRIATDGPVPTHDIALIASLWVLIVCVVNPVGDFPLVDDWAFGRTVKHLLESGEYDPLGWGYMTLITNVSWGALFCLPSGFSFTALRISTLTASLGCLIGAYVLARDLHWPRWFAMLFVMLLGFNPVYVALSHSFMTDVPFAALSIWASIFFIRTLRTGSNTHLLCATVLAVAATLSRQLALCIPLAFALTALCWSRATMRAFVRGLMPALACSAAYLIVYRAGMIGVKVDQLVVSSLPDLHKLGRTFIHNLYFGLIYLGLFLLPITMVAMRSPWKSPDRYIFTSALTGIATMVALVLTRWRMGEQIFLPVLSANIVVRSGVGPTSTHDVYVLGLDNMQPLPWGFWIVVTAMAMAGAAVLVALVIRRTAVLLSALRSGLRRQDETIGVFALLASAAYLALLLPSPLFFDRYVIPMMPLLVVAIMGSTELIASVSRASARTLRVTAIAMIAAFGLFAIAGTRDYLTWSRLRWAALQELMRDSRVSPEDIDGGFEFNGFYLYNPPFVATKDVGTKSPWWVHRDTYRAGFGPMPGYQIVKEYSYRHWLPWHVQTVVVLRKE